MSLSAVQKRVRGVKGRDAPTGMTDLKSWDAFEEEVSHIWINARDYNEDGSEIHNLSIEFEVSRAPHPSADPANSRRKFLRSG
jgi:hypothetical protein